MEPSKHDWNLFKSKISLWQEAYMEKLVNQYLRLLTQDQPASKAFWDLCERIEKDKRKPGVILDLRKSKMIVDILLLLKDKAITFDDLKDFSDDLKEEVERLMKFDIVV